MSIKSATGLDGFDLAIHGAITLALWAAVAAMGGHAEEAIIGGSVILTGSLVVLGLRRSLARRRERLGLTTGEMAAERIAELEQRMADLESVQTRVLDLEERVDFTERLLARSEPRPLESEGRPQ